MRLHHIFAALIPACICMEAASYDREGPMMDLPVEIIQLILSNLSYFYLVRTLSTSKKLDKIVSDAIGAKYGLPESQLKLAEIGTENFAENQLDKFAIKLFKRFYLPRFHGAIEKIFSGNDEKLTNSDIESLDSDEVLIKVAFKHCNFEAPIIIGSLHLEIAGWDIAAQQKALSFNGPVLESYISKTPVVDFQLMRNLTALCQDELNPVLLHILEKGSMDIDCLQVGVPDGSAIVLALRIGKTLDDAAITCSLLDSFEDLKSEHILVASRLNPEKPFVLRIVDHCTKYSSIVRGPLGQLLISHNCDPDYFLALQGVEKGYFDPENLAQTINNFKMDRDKSVSLVKCALAMGKSEQFVADLIDQLDSFVFDTQNLLPFLMVKGVSDQLAFKIFNKPAYNEGCNNFYFTTPHLFARMKKGFAKLSSGAIFGIYQATKKEQSFHGFVQLVKGFSLTFEILEGIIDLAIAEDCLESLHQLCTSYFLLSDDPYANELKSLYLYAVFKSNGTLFCNHPATMDYLKRLPNIYDRELLESYVRDASPVERSSNDEAAPNQAHLLAQYYLSQI